MAYLSNSDIESVLGTSMTIELTDDTGTGSVDAAVVTTARLGAEGEANSYFAARHQVPIDLTGEPELSAVIRSFVVDLAIYRLHSRKPPVPDDVVRRREEAIHWLLRVAEGRVILPSASVLPDNDAAGTLGESSGPTRIMTRETLDDI